MLEQTLIERKSSLTEAERQQRANYKFVELLKDTIYHIDNGELVSKLTVKTNDGTGNIVVCSHLQFDKKSDCFVMLVEFVLYTVDEDGESKESVDFAVLTNPTRDQVVEMVESYKSFTNVQAPEPTEEDDEVCW